MPNSIIKVLSKFSSDLLAEEGITQKIIDYVDLDVACSPVICYRGETLREAVTVSASVDPNRYLLRHPMIPKGFVAKDELRIMRARYLLARNGRPNPKPIVTIRTDSPEGMAQARQLFAALGIPSNTPNPTP